MNYILHIIYIKFNLYKYLNMPGKEESLDDQSLCKFTVNQGPLESYDKLDLSKYFTLSDKYSMWTELAKN